MRALPTLYRAVLPAAVSIACGNDSAHPSAPAPGPPLGSSTGETLAVEGTADLALTKVADRRIVRVGENITFTITLTNLGPETATGVVFGDALPDPLNLVTFTCSLGNLGGRSFCAVDTLATGASVTATLVATPIRNPPESERRFTNTATVLTSDLPDPNTDNDMASTMIHIIGETP